MGFKFQTLLAAIGLIVCSATESVLKKEPIPDGKIAPAPTPSGSFTDAAEKLPGDKKDTQKEPVTQYSRTMKFGADGTFRVVQLSDLWHDGDLTKLGQTNTFVGKLLSKEKPDFIVITGDIVDPSKAQFYTQYWASVMAPILESGIPYAHTGGSIIDSFLYQQVDRQFGKDASWSGYKWNLETTRVPGSEKDIGYFTGRIPVMDSTGKFELMSLYTMDTTTFPECSKTLPGKSCLSRYAISWFEEQQDLYAHNNTRRDFMFMHRPIQEFMTLGNMYSITGHKQQAISCQATNTGMFAVAREKMGVGWIGAGGDSNNDFSGNYHDIFLSYGRKSGFGGDGDLLRGARVFNFVKPQYDDMHVTTWVTDENGYRNADMVPHPAPYFQSAAQLVCGVDPFQAMIDYINS